MTFAGILTDLILILIFVICIFVGKKRGLLLSLFSLFAVLIAIVLAFLLRAPVEKVISATSFPTKVSDTVYNKLEKNQTSQGKVVTGDELLDELQAPKFFRDLFTKEIEGFQTGKTFSVMARAIGDGVAKVAVSALAVFILFILILVIMFVLRIVLKLFTRLPVIHQFDELGGMIFGFVQAFLLVSTICLLLSACSHSETFAPMYKAVKSSFLTSFIYNQNILGLILAKFL